MSMFPLALTGHSLLYLTMVAVYLVVITGCIVVVLKENRNPIRSLAWVIALIFLPGVGFLFYAFFGRSLKGMQLLSRRSRKKLLQAADITGGDAFLSDLSPQDRALYRLARSVCHSRLYVNNEIEPFTEGRVLFDALMCDIREAKSSIYFQFYIFADDETGRMISDLLIAKAREGVIVKVLYDHVGSFSSSNKFFRHMKENGVDVHPFFRVTFPQLANRINWRNHRKVVVIDNKVGYIGGMNIADRYYKSHNDAGVWRDTHFRLKGDILESLLYSFAIDWNFLKKNISPLPIKLEPNPIRNNVGMQLVTSGPTDYWDNLSLCFLKAISNATESICIQTPYFLPTDSLLHALEAAALSKIDVRIMIPGKCDSKMLQYASYSYLTQCMRAGIKVYIYEPGMIHAKMMIIDSDFATVGSTNFDFRSLENNFECNLLVYDSSFNKQCRQIFRRDQHKCRHVLLKEWKKRPLYSRFMESLVRLFSPIL